MKRGGGGEPPVIAELLKGNKMKVGGSMRGKWIVALCVVMYRSRLSPMCGGNRLKSSMLTNTSGFY